MNVKIDKRQLEINLEQIKKNNSNVAFLIKRQLLCKDICEVLKNEKVYSTGDTRYVDIYNNKNCIVVDAFDSREGITMEEAKTYSNKKTAIVNFACCNGKIPTVKEVNKIYDKLKSYDWQTVSIGGSMMLWYKGIKADEIRVGEVLTTGYSTVYNEFYKSCKNPFKLEVDVYKQNQNNWILKEGFFNLETFTNCKTKCVNTDFTVISKKYKIEKQGKVILEPDYYTLMKLAHNGYVE